MLTYIKPEITLIYPFARENLPPAQAANCLVIRPGSIHFDTRLDGVTFTPEAVRMLAEALLHAVEEAERGVCSDSGKRTNTNRSL